MLKLDLRINDKNISKFYNFFASSKYYNIIVFKNFN